jgi:hypothetical protein
MAILFCGTFAPRRNRTPTDAQRNSAWDALGREQNLHLQERRNAAEVSYGVIFNFGWVEYAGYRRPVL